MSDVTCHNHFVHSQTSHSSCIHFRVHVASHDMIQCGMTWKRIQLHSHGTDIHTGLKFALSHGVT